MGKTLFFVLWPIAWFFAPLRVRVRVVVQFENKILVVINWFGGGGWQLPGGGMKFGESIRQTAVREIKEELDIIFTESDVKLLTSSPIIVKQFGLLMRYQYVGVKLKTSPKIKTSREITKIKWVNHTSPLIPKRLSSSL